jgi:hypothetical protein
VLDPLHYNGKIKDETSAEKVADFFLGLMPVTPLIRDAMSANPVSAGQWILDSLSTVLPFIPGLGEVGPELREGAGALFGVGEDAGRVGAAA